jgi:hypothetical protein
VLPQTREHLLRDLGGEFVSAELASHRVDAVAVLAVRISQKLSAFIRRLGGVCSV